MSILAQTGSLPHPRRKLEEITAVLGAGHGSHQAFRSTWLERAPDGCRAPAEGFEEAMAPVLPEGPKVRQRTNDLVERMAREFRRFLRPRQALRSSATAPALVALAVAQIKITGAPHRVPGSLTHLTDHYPEA